MIVVTFNTDCNILARPSYSAGDFLRRSEGVVHGARRRTDNLQGFKVMTYEVLSRSRGKRVATRLLFSMSADWPLFRSFRRAAIRRLTGVPDLSPAGRVGLETSHLYEGSRLTLGSGVEIASDVVLDVSGALSIGSDVTISEGAILFTHNHLCRERDRHWREQGLQYFDLSIGDGAWIGARSVILGSVGRIGEGAIIGAGAVVTHEVAPYTIVAGNPAKQIATRT